METKIIDGIEYVKGSDYLAADDNVKINHILVDMQDKKIISHEKMNLKEKEKRNASARKVGEMFLVWCPALFA